LKDQKTAKGVRDVSQASVRLCNSNLAAALCEE